MYKDSGGGSSSHYLSPRAPGVLNFHFDIGVRPEGPKMGLKERVGTKNRGLKNWFFGKKIGHKELNFLKK